MNAQTQKEWLGQVREDIIEPDRPIVDPHHHLWRHRETPYLLEDLWADTGSGHNIEQTVFVECAAEYRKEGPEAMRPVGETDFVLGVAEDSKKFGPGQAQIAAIVGFADFTLGEAVGEVLAVHEEAGKGLFRGIRHAAGWDASQEVRNSHTNPHEHLYADPAFRAGFAQLEKFGMTCDAWHYHTQIHELTDLARAYPGITIIHDHFGGPLGIGPYEGRRSEIKEQWKKEMAELATCPNVVCKIGGLAMPINGFGFHKNAKPATSDELVEAHQDYYHFTIDQFGPDRCMFESNFPVDKQSISYAVLWNAFKKIAKDYSKDEKEQLFRGTAKRIYRLEAA